MFQFKVLSTDKKTKSRVGKIITPHGTIDTPAFVPVGTQATVKSLTPQDLKEIGVQIFFGNTYHLHLRPGEDVVKDFGGLAKFMGRKGQTMTDSGGFQVFSLNRGKTLIRTRNNAEDFSVDPRIDLRGSAPLVKITKDGVVFRSHIDGTLHTFSPEKSIEIQQKLGADIILTFDECAPYPSTYEYTKQAMERTHGWAVRCLKHYYSTSEESFHNTSEVTIVTPRRNAASASSPALDRRGSPNGLLRGGHKQALFGIIQGGVYKDLREESARFIADLPFDGIAIGGVAVGESKKQMRDVLDWVVPILPEDKPRHLLGVGEVDDIFDIIERGIDMFDCVIPTRLGRTGFILVSPPEGNLKNRFRIDINKSKFAKDKKPLSKDCKCYACQNFTRGYAHHLFRSRELLAYRLATYHNLYFINNLVQKIREAILEDKFDKIRNEWLHLQI